MLVQIFCDWVAGPRGGLKSLAPIRWSHTTRSIALNQSLDKLLSPEGVYPVPRWSVFAEKARACWRLQNTTTRYEDHIWKDTNDGLRAGRFGECEQWGDPTDQCSCQPPVTQSSFEVPSLLDAAICDAYDKLIKRVSARVEAEHIDSKDNDRPSGWKMPRIEFREEEDEDHGHQAGVLGGLLQRQGGALQTNHAEDAGLGDVGKALLATGIGLIVNDLGAWPEPLHPEIKVLCQKWRLIAAKHMQDPVHGAAVCPIHEKPFRGMKSKDFLSKAKGMEQSLLTTLKEEGLGSDHQWLKSAGCQLVQWGSSRKSRSWMVSGSKMQRRCSRCQR